MDREKFEKSRDIQNDLYTLHRLDSAIRLSEINSITLEVDRYNKTFLSNFPTGSLENEIIETGLKAMEDKIRSLIWMREQQFKEL